ncbi:DUF6258 family protein [Acidovorax sp. FG27]|uniref:DUF6258 family protein n=1 Tax=Acidovorax sp. FG27 TaxID=3133652 RepID=UPI0030E7864B
MTPDQFIKTIYLGDRLCLSIAMEGTKKRLLLKVDCISRVRGNSWNYYAAEDVQEGFLVFEGVSSCRLEVNGQLPNDWIEPVSVTQLNDKADAWEFVFGLGVVDSQGRSSENLLTVIAERLVIETKDGVRLCY